MSITVSENKPLPLSQELTEEQKRLAKLDQSLRRMCKPKASGRLEVSPEVATQWQKGGPARKALLDLLVQCDGDKDRCCNTFLKQYTCTCHWCMYTLPCLQEAFKKRVEHVRTQKKRNTLKVHVGWYSKENMKKKLGWPAPVPHIFEKSQDIIVLVHSDVF